MESKQLNKYVERASCFEVSISLEPQDTLIWEWRLHNHDIGFEVKFVPTPGNAALSIFPSKRISTASQISQTGSYTASKSGTLNVIWDNTFSWTKGKNLTYELVKSTILCLGSPVDTKYGSGVIEKYRPADHIYQIKLDFGGYAYLLRESILCVHSADDNTRAMTGVDMFFNNQITEAEQFFLPEIKQKPMFALGYAAIGFIKVEP